MADFRWSEEAKTDLRKWYVLDGMSASQIAKALAGKYKQPVSRSAVIGKLHRLGVSQEVRESRPSAPKAVSVAPVRETPTRVLRQTAVKLAPAPAAPAKPSTTAPINPAPVAPMPEPAPELVVVGQAVVLLDLKSACCKYPVGPTPPAGEMHLQLFCAAETGDSIRPYCDKHERVAWKSASAADRAKRLQNDIKAAHRDMVSRNARRHTTATRAVF